MPKKSVPAKKSLIVEVEKVVNVANVVSKTDPFADVAALQRKVTDRLQSIGTDLAGKVAEYNAVVNAIALKEAELKSLYEVGNLAEALDTLKNQHETEMLSHQERLSELVEERRRETEEYNYNLKLIRRKSDQDFADELDKNRRAESLRKATLEADWSRREAALKAVEVETKELVAQVDNFPKELEKAVAKAVQDNTKSLNTAHSAEISRVAAEKTHAEQLANSKIESLNLALSEANSRNSYLNVQIDKLRDDVTKVANKAMDAASGKEALAALQASTRETSTKNATR